MRCSFIINLYSFPEQIGHIHPHHREGCLACAAIGLAKTVPVTMHRIQLSCYPRPGLVIDMDAVREFYLLARAMVMQSHQQTLAK